MGVEITPFRIDMLALEAPDHLTRDLREFFGKVHGCSRERGR